jgi:Sec-independent protein translocase protein TatA
MTMKKILSIHILTPLALVVFVALMVSCSAKEKADNLKETIGDAILKIEKDASDISNEDWAKYEEQIEELKSAMKTNEEDFTPEEIEENNKLIGKYYALKATQKLGDFKKELKNVGQQLEGAFEALFETNEQQKE